MRHLAILAALALGACATTGGGLPPAPTTPAQTVYVLESGLTTAIGVASAYASLPRCGSGNELQLQGSAGEPIGGLCSDAATVQKIDVAANAAASAVTAAQAMVNGHAATAQQIADAVNAAQAALNGLTKLTNGVKTK